MALPNTRRHAPGKNSMIIGGTSTNQPAAAKTPMKIRNTTVLDRKPIITAVGAKGNTVGASSAGRELGISRSLMPLNAGTISARNIRTPNSRIAMPAANRRPAMSAQTHGLRSSL
jgi:hypothetical protein